MLVEAFVRELRIVLDLDARLLSSQAPEVAMSSIDGGPVFAFVELYDLICT